MLSQNAQYFWKLETPFSSRIPIFVKLILFSRYLGGNVYLFALEVSSMLYKNAMLGIFGEWNSSFYFQNLYFYEINAHCPIFKG